MNRRDLFILEKMIKYSDEIAEAIDELALDYSKFSASSLAKNAISMCVLQIGELANGLNPEFRGKYPEIRWRDIINMRNKAAHGYLDMDAEIIWQTAIIHIPELKSFCEKVLREDG